MPASLCRACGETFSSTAQFDRHRVGAYDIAKPHFGRSCLSTDAIRARGLLQNGRGVWTKPLTDAARESLRALKVPRKVA